MRVHQWDNYDVYLKTQASGSRRRYNRRPGANNLEFDRIARYLKRHSVTKAICHGARCGTEVQLLKERFPGAEVLGTDLHAKDPALVLEWDFHVTKPEWIKAFDVVYSNSLDHSPKPKECLQGWFGQLKPNGFLFLCWTFMHTLEKYTTLPCPCGDCFGAALHEYIALIQQTGIMRDLLWVPIGHGQIVIVASPRK